MILKKMNAVIALLLIAGCLTHVGAELVFSLSGGEGVSHDSMEFLSGIVMSLAMPHVLITILIVIFSHEKKIVIRYPGANVRIILQRVSGVFMLVFLFLHMKTSDRLSSHADCGTGYCLLNYIIMAFFFAMVFLHISVSFSGALVTLGAVESMKKKRMIDRIVWVISGSLFLASAVIVIYGYRAMIGGMGV
ncbi:MAG: hypothetical protein K5897_03235 [Eubacterium sp.]|nr:hypothetical protein [Eubacterium sp.]